MRSTETTRTIHADDDCVVFFVIVISFIIYFVIIKFAKKKNVNTLTHSNSRK